MKPPPGVPPTVPDEPAPRAATTVDDDEAAPTGAAPATATTQPDDEDVAGEAAVLRLLEATRGPARPLRLVADLCRLAAALAVTFVAWQGLLRVSNTGATEVEPTRTILPALLAFVVTRLVFRMTSRRFVRPLRGMP